MEDSDRIEEPENDLRSVGRPADPKPADSKSPEVHPETDESDVAKPDAEEQEDGGLEPLEVPEPLFLPREQQIENYYRLLDDDANRDFLHVAEVVKVRSIGQILPFMSRSMDAYKRARMAPGFVAAASGPSGGVRPFGRISFGRKRSTGSVSPTSAAAPLSTPGYKKTPALARAT